jgi:hypothetical protein
VEVATAGAIELVVVVAAALLLAEHVRGELVEVAAVEDKTIGLVDLRELAAAGAKEEQIGDEVGAGEDLRGQPEGAHEVMAAQHPIPELRTRVAAAGHEAGRY